MAGSGFHPSTRRVPRVHKIHKIAIVTDDIEEAVQFYTQKLGLTVVERFENDEDEDYVFLDAGGILLELMPQRTTGRNPASTTSPSRLTASRTARNSYRTGGLRSPRSPLM